VSLEAIRKFRLRLRHDSLPFSFDNVSLLVISTGDKTYIFDLYSLNIEKTVTELKKVLSSESQLKIVYDARNLVSNLKTKFQLKLQPVFDVMLVAAQFYSSESVIGLKNIVKTVLGVEIDVEEFKGIVNRPLNHEILHSFASQTAFLVAMYHKLAMKGFSYAFGKYSVDSVDKSKDFFNVLSSTDSQKLELQLQPTETLKVDFSIYAEL
jgi:DNA polymerase I-like protein with 3'-5' exonuclease and polymerase domains